MMPCKMGMLRSSLSVLHGCLPGLLATLVAVTGSAKVYAAKGEIPLYQLPLAVSETMQREYPGARFTGAKMKREFAREVYEIAGKTGDGHTLVLVVTTRGEPLAANTDISVKEVPKEVTETLNHWLKGFQTTTIMRSVRDGGTRVWYQFKGKSKSGQKVIVEIRADGKKIDIEEM